MPVLPDRSSASAFLGRYYVDHLSPHDDLLEGGGVTPYMFCTAAVYPLFLRLLPLFSALDVIGGKTYRGPMSPDLWFNVSTLGYICWSPPFVPKG